MKPILFYIYDPMCSWCWGYRNTWLSLKNRLEPFVDIKYRVGGLAPDSDQVMPEQMQSFLQNTWRSIEEKLGTQFNYDFWTKCIPRRSTYPACRAVRIAREYNLEQQMFFAIQKAYYLNAQNPSDELVLISLAVSIGINEKDFAIKLKSDAINELLIKEIEQVHNMPIQGFPSLILSINDQFHQIPINYNDSTETLKIIKDHL